MNLTPEYLAQIHLLTIAFRMSVVLVSLGTLLARFFLVNPLLKCLNDRSSRRRG